MSVGSLKCAVNKYNNNIRKRIKLSKYNVIIAKLIKIKKKITKKLTFMSDMSVTPTINQ